MKKKNSQAVLVASKYLSSLGNRAESEAWVHIQDEFLFLLVLSPLLSTRKQGSLLKSSLPSSTRSRVPAPVICIPVYERVSLQSVGSGKRLSVDIGTVKKTSWSLFLIASGLWTESDSFLCCIFSPLALRTSIAQCFLFIFCLLGTELNRGIIWRKIQQRKKTQFSQCLLHAWDLQIFY